MNISTTTDLAKFGYREIEMLRDILNAWANKGLPEAFKQDEIHPMFNLNSGNVFLVNSEYQIAMLNGEDLEEYHICPECGFEVFYSEFENGIEQGYGAKQCCEDYIKTMNEE